MFLRRIDIDEFRNLKGINISLGKTMTAIAGHNATGKSTILALLGHSAELVSASQKPLIGTRFQCKWEEVKDHRPSRWLESLNRSKRVICHAD
jgi:recombinational DNA repair ATPase RecF